jgi:hypothetical protein
MTPITICVDEQDERAVSFPKRTATTEESYDSYFNPYNMKILMQSINQARNGQTVTKSLAELEAMEDD